MKPDHYARRTLARTRLWKSAVATNVLASILLATGLLVLVNLFATRLPHRINLAEYQLYQLGETTRRVLDHLPGTVHIVLLASRSNELYQHVEHLLNEYQYHSPLIHVEYVDPDRNLARTEELVRRFDLQQPDLLVVHRDNRHQLIPIASMLDTPRRTTSDDSPPSPPSFRGEQLLTSALHHVTEAEAANIYFLAGHGEKSLENYDPYVGYSSIARRLRADHMNPRVLYIGETGGIPADAHALIIAGPTRRIAQPELEIIHRYIENSGRVMFLLDALTRTGVEPILTRWGVQLTDDIVLDPSRTLTGREVFITEYQRHPITDPLHSKTAILHQPRSVQPLTPRPSPLPDLADKPQVSVLASTSASGWGERDPDQTPLRFDPTIDIPGPVPLAVAVERGPVPGFDVHIRPTRLVVFGDSSFVANGALTGGDEDFFMSALNWLLDRDQWLAIGVRDVQQIHLSLDRRTRRELLLWVMGAVPGTIALLGLFVWLNRRR